MTDPKTTPDLWVFENQTPHLRLGWRVTEILRHEMTPFQELLVVDTAESGRALFLDGCVMLTEKDEYFYHEMIAHVPLFAHPLPERVLIVGGGDGGTLREVLKHREVKECVLCDIDQRVTEASRAFFPTLSVGFDNPRATLLHEDALVYIKEQRGAFDVILVDSTDPVGPAVGLFEKPFYASLAASLKPGGIISAQAESPIARGQDVRKVMNGLSATFPKAQLYLGLAPSYPGALWAFGTGRLSGDLSPKRPLAFDTRYYTTEIHRLALELPPFVKELIR